MKPSTAVLFLALVVVSAGWAKEREGSIPEDLAAKRPPRPNDLYVAALPFWAGDERHADLARAAVMLNLLRHGFKLAPSGSRSLAAVARRTDSEVRRDTKREPLARLEAKDAARLGKVLGAQWAIYGEVGDLHTESEGRTFAPRKTGVMDVRLAVVEVESGEILYWARVRDKLPGGNGLWTAKATSIERRLLTQTVNEIFDDIGKGLPEHYVSAEVSQETVRQVAESLGE